MLFTIKNINICQNGIILLILQKSNLFNQAYLAILLEEIFNKNNECFYFSTFKSRVDLLPFLFCLHLLFKA